jgi:hypothetical protein
VGYLISSLEAGLGLSDSDARCEVTLLNYSLSEDFTMLRARHGRMTSLASALLRMFLTA